jgi:hypothetical protein
MDLKMGRFQCPIDHEAYLDYDCRKCEKFLNHLYLLKNYGSRAICGVAVNLRKEDGLEVELVP